ncbi:hypothetical protein DFS33DRAFT_1276551 [Desarmillaria ectypa]|nr:hypothetical protein DFS33DRAFT_1276551 [Desarmillaria ectypa]
MMIPWTFIALHTFASHNLATVLHDQKIMVVIIFSLRLSVMILLRYVTIITSTYRIPDTFGMSKVRFSVENEEHLDRYTYLLSNDLIDRKQKSAPAILSRFSFSAVSGNVKEDTVELGSRLSFTSYFVSSLRTSRVLTVCQAQRLGNSARGDGLWRDRRTPGTEMVFLSKLQRCDGTNKKIWLNSTFKDTGSPSKTLACATESHNVNDMPSGRGNANVPRLLSFRWVFYQHFRKEGEARQAYPHLI